MREQKRIFGVNLNRLSDFGFDIGSRFFADSLLESNFQKEMGDIVNILLDFRISVEELIRGGGGEASQTQRLSRGLEAHRWNKHIFSITKSVTLEDSLAQGGFKDKVFERVTESETHEIDHMKIVGDNILALEIEWNNKPTFFARDLQAYGRLHDDGVIAAGIIITRGKALQDNLRNIIMDFAKKNEITGIDSLRPWGYEPTNRQKAVIQSSMNRGMPFHEAWARLFTSDKYGSSTTHWETLMKALAQGGSKCPILSIGLPQEIITR
tara:strand:+ start:272 stop:1072 length:801 start_codon:yes stop_codon:yes gene_type:complete